MIYVASLDTFPNLRKKSTWSPPDHQILGALNEKITEMESIIKSLKLLKETPNLNKSELKALQQLKKDTNIIIKPADKGSATVILDKEYTAEGIRQLSIRNNFR